MQKKLFTTTVHNPNPCFPKGIIPLRPYSATTRR